MNTKPRLNALFFEAADYDASMSLQSKIHAGVAAGDLDPHLLIFDYAQPVITLGKNASISDLHVTPEFLSQAGVLLRHEERGGELTAHLPGQLVAYPILRLDDFHLGVRSYVQTLEESLIDLLDLYGLKGAQRPGRPGIWLEDGKVASLGIRIKKRCTLYGIAINRDASLRVFDFFRPCGENGLQIDQLSRHLEPCPSFRELGGALSRILSKRLAIDTAFTCDQTRKIELRPAANPNP